MTGPELIGLVAETHVHVGIGQSVEAVDLPVARERTTHWPFVPGSGVKGAFRVWAAEQAGIKGIDGLFGKEGADSGSDGNAGKLMFSDARLLLLPVRALNKAWRWVTSPGLLRRHARDLQRAGQENGYQLPEVTTGKWLGNGEGWLGLEEREFDHAGEVPDDVVAAMAKVTGEDATFLRERLVILHDDDFAWSARYALPVMARNALDENKRVKGGALWYEESLAPDSVLYVLVGERRPGSIEGFTEALRDAPISRWAATRPSARAGFAWSRSRAWEAAMARRRKRMNRNKAPLATAPRPGPTPAAASAQAASRRDEAAPAPRRSQAQKRAEHALNKVEGLVAAGDYGNHAAYVKALPARIIMNGLGQALAMERAGEKKDKGHKLLFSHVQNWLLNGWEHSPYKGQTDILAALVKGGEEDYIRAQGEAMAYLEWLKKFAAAFLKEPETEDGGGKDADAAA